MAKSASEIRPRSGQTNKKSSITFLGGGMVRTKYGPCQKEIAQNWESREFADICSFISQLSYENVECRWQRDATSLSSPGAQLAPAEESTDPRRGGQGTGSGCSPRRRGRCGAEWGATSCPELAHAPPIPCAVFCPVRPPLSLCADHTAMPPKRPSHRQQPRTSWRLPR